MSSYIFDAYQELKRLDEGALEVDIDNKPYMYGKAHSDSLNNIINIKKIISNIHAKAEKDSKPPVGNQNCMLCTWCCEAQIRGIDILPRPVYSPRDIIFSIDKPYSFIKGGTQINFDSIDALKDICLDGQRFYIHVNWADSSSGHEFLIINQSGNLFIADAQAGILTPIDSPESAQYLNDINFSNSYIVRIDNKPLDNSILKYNNDEYIIDWEDTDYKSF